MRDGVCYSAETLVSQANQTQPIADTVARCSVLGCKAGGRSDARHALGMSAVHRTANHAVVMVHVYFELLRAGGLAPIYKDGSFYESWHDVSFNTDVDYNQSREPSATCQDQRRPR